MNFKFWGKAKRDWVLEIYTGREWLNLQTQPRKEFADALQTLKLYQNKPLGLHYRFQIHNVKTGEIVPGELV